MSNTVTYCLLPNDHGYRAGSDGTIWTCLVREAFGDGRPGSHCVPGPIWRPLRPGTQKATGRKHVAIRGRSRLVHHLVLEAFVGPRPNGMEACHTDDDFSNNALSNLRWDTPSSNVADRIRNGKQPRGERHGRSKITADTVRAIRAEHAAGGISQVALAAKHGLDQRLVSRIIRRERWTHIV